MVRYNLYMEQRLCRCGCGEPTTPYRHTDHRCGVVKGQYQPFLRGHWRFRPTEDRFWEKVDKSGDCWLWTASTSGFGYGQFLSPSGSVAHRYSYELHYGPIPDGLFVLHHCDNPPCVRPEHLFLGTDKDNVQDMLRKGRDNHPKGEHHPRAKLTSDSVRQIRLRRSLGITQQEISSEFGVSRAVVRAVLSGKTWVHVP